MRKLWEDLTQLTSRTFSFLCIWKAELGVLKILFSK